MGVEIPMENTLRISIVDDNPTFLKIFYGRLERHLFQLERYWDCHFILHAFNSTEELMEKMKTPSDVLFLDYHLEDEVTADQVLYNLYRTDKLNKAVIMSEDKGYLNGLGYFREHISTILRKDTTIVPRSCVLIEELLLSKYHEL